VRLLQRFFSSFAFADVAQDCLKISAADCGDGDFYGNDLAVLAHELPLEAQSAFSLQFFQPLLEQVTFFRQVGVGDRRSDEFVLRNLSQLSPCAVSQNTDTISIDDVDCVG
jgi:hypothetical protein